IKPESSGGPTTLENLQTLFIRCNSIKNSRNITLHAVRVRAAELDWIASHGPSAQCAREVQRSGERCLWSTLPGQRFCSRHLDVATVSPFNPASVPVTLAPLPAPLPPQPSPPRRRTPRYCLGCGTRLIGHALHQCRVCVDEARAVRLQLMEGMWAGGW